MTLRHHEARWWLKIVAEIIGVIIFTWILCVGFARAQQHQNPTVDWQTRRDVTQLQDRMDTVLGPDNQGGYIKQINNHLYDTDKNVTDLNSFMNKLLGGLIALGGLQTFNLVASLFTGKKEDK